MLLHFEALLSHHALKMRGQMPTAYTPMWAHAGILTAIADNILDVGGAYHPNTRRR